MKKVITENKNEISIDAIGAMSHAFVVAVDKDKVVAVWGEDIDGDSTAMFYDDCYSPFDDNYEFDDFKKKVVKKSKEAKFYLIEAKDFK